MSNHDQPSRAIGDRAFARSRSSILRTPNIQTVHFFISFWGSFPRARALHRSSKLNLFRVESEIAHVKSRGL